MAELMRIDPSSTLPRSIVPEEQDTTQQPTSLADRSDGPVSRKALHEMVWSEPMLKVTGRFGVSSSHMAPVCTPLNLPRPERGYWALTPNVERRIYLTSKWSAQ